MSRFTKTVFIAVASVFLLFTIGVVRADAAEATLTEVVEAVKSDQTELSTVKAEVSALKAEIVASGTVAHEDASHIAVVLGEVHEVVLHGEPTVKVPLPLEVNCASGCVGGGSGGEVELTSKAEAKLSEGNKESAVFIVGSICGLFLCIVIWVMVRPRTS